MSKTSQAAKPRSRTSGTARTVATALAVTALAAASPPAHAQYRHVMANDMSRCAAGSGSAVMVTVEGVKSSSGRLRIQTYRATAGEWLTKGKWLARVEAPARAGSMNFCLPLPGPGTYGVAVRHDLNGNGETDILSDGGGMSNNPSINVLNLGKPSHTKVGVPVGNAPKAIRIQMKYM